MIQQIMQMTKLSFFEMASGDGEKCFIMVEGVEQWWRRQRF
jgi:hypothetical protein